MCALPNSGCTPAGRRVSRVVPAAGAGCRIRGLRHPIESATEAVTDCESPAAGWKTGTVAWRATLRASLDAARATASCRKGVPGVPSQGLDLAESVVYLSWTGDVPVVYPPYTCAGNAPDHEAARS